MKETVEFAELFQPLFLGGKNHGIKLFNRNGITMELDRENDELLVTYNNRTMHIQLAQCYYELKNENNPIEYKNPIPASIPNKKINAQVSTPMGHVFQGEGAGKTNDRQRT